jgi:hypothetical protein
MAQFQQTTELLNTQLTSTDQEQIAYNPPHHSPQEGVSHDVHANKAAFPPASRLQHPANGAPPC